MKHLLRYSLILFIGISQNAFAQQEDTISTRVLDNVLIRDSRLSTFLPDVEGVNIYSGKKTNLIEEMKWGQPCFTFNGKNICIIGELKKGVVLGFFKGALLDDKHKILDKPGKSTQSARYVSFTSVAAVNKLKPVIQDYIYKAIEIEEAGAKVDFKKDLEPAPKELLDQFKKMPKLKTAFYSLTPGRQRAYIIYFSQPKQSATRVARIDKYTGQILEGVGINDKYSR